MLTDSSEVLGGIINPDDGEATPLEHVELSGDSLSCESPTDGSGTAPMEIVVDGDSFEDGIRTWTSSGPSQCRERVRSRTFAGRNHSARTTAAPGRENETASSAKAGGRGAGVYPPCSV